MEKKAAKEFQTSLLLDPAVKEKAKVAAARSGRSTSAELRMRIERSFADEEVGAALNSPVVRMVAQAIRQAEATSAKQWFEDAHTAQKCRALILGVINLMMPDQTNVLGSHLPSGEEIDGKLAAIRIAMKVDVEGPEAKVIGDQLDTLQAQVKGAKEQLVEKAASLRQKR